MVKFRSHRTGKPPSRDNRRVFSRKLFQSRRCAAIKCLQQVHLHNSIKLFSFITKKKDFWTWLAAGCINAEEKSRNMQINWCSRRDQSRILLRVSCSYVEQTASRRQNQTNCLSGKKEENCADEWNFQNEIHWGLGRGLIKRGNLPCDKQSWRIRRTDSLRRCKRLGFHWFSPRRKLFQQQQSAGEWMKRRDNTHRTGVDIATDGRFGAPPLAIARPPTVQLRAGCRLDSRNFISFWLLINLMVQVDLSFNSKSCMWCDDVLSY